MENFQQSLECCIEIWNSFNVRTWSIRYESSKKKQAHKAPYVLYGSYAPFSKIVMWCLCTWVCACTTHTNYFQWSVQHRCFMHEHRFKWISPHSHIHTQTHTYNSTHNTMRQHRGDIILKWGILLRFSGVQKIKVHFTASRSQWHSFQTR